MKKDQHESRKQLEELTRIEELKRQQLEKTIQELREKISGQIVKMDDMNNKHTLECDHIHEYTLKKPSNNCEKIDQKN